MYLKKSLIPFIFLMIFSSVTFADVSLPRFFSNNMVLQRDMPITVFGFATVGETATVTFNGQTATSTADSNGQWQIKLPAMVFGGPFTLTVQGTSNTINYTNVLIGDVYLCSGQSNMEFRLNQEASSATEIPASTNTNIRLLTVPKNFNTVAQNDIPPVSWLSCDPSSSATFSAVAYYFGKNLQVNLNIPIGLITSAWYQTSIRSWMAWDEITQIDPDYKKYAGQTIEQASGKTQAVYMQDVSGYAPTWPSTLYNGMINPLIKTGIKGVIWYQGENNANEAIKYKTLFQDMISDWRKRFGYDFSFMWVQLPGYGAETTSPQESQWAELRDVQNSTLSIPKTAQAVITDLGDVTNIHPTNKKDVGYRLAQCALKLNYGQAILGSGPVLSNSTFNSNSITLEFTNTGTGLVAKNIGVLNGFTIAGMDRKFYNATATIDGNNVIVSCSNVPNPAITRYAWYDNPRTSNLTNGDGFLASPFQRFSPNAGVDQFVLNVTVPLQTTICYVSGNFNAWSITANQLTYISTDNTAGTKLFRVYLPYSFVGSGSFQIVAGTDWSFAASNGNITAVSSGMSQDVIVPSFKAYPYPFTINVTVPVSVNDCYVAGGQWGWTLPTSAQKMTLVSTDASTKVFAISIYDKAPTHSVSVKFLTGLNGTNWTYQQTQAANFAYSGTDASCNFTCDSFMAYAAPSTIQTINSNTFSVKTIDRKIIVDGKFCNVTLFDLQGRLIQSQKNNTAYVYTNLTPGLYILRVDNYSFKLIIN